MDQIPPGTDLSKIGLAPHPEGLPPNLIDAPSREHYPLAFGLPLIVISSAFVAVRLGTNLKFSGKLFPDDCQYTAARRELCLI